MDGYYSDCGTGCSILFRQRDYCCGHGETFTGDDDCGRNRGRHYVVGVETVDAFRQPSSDCGHSVPMFLDDDWLLIGGRRLWLSYSKRLFIRRYWFLCVD